MPFQVLIYLLKTTVACIIFYSMDDSHRPVRLRKVVLGFPKGSNFSEFRFDLSLNYKLSGIIQTYSDRKPTLVVRQIEILSRVANRNLTNTSSNDCQAPFMLLVDTWRMVRTNLFVREFPILSALDKYFLCSIDSFVQQGRVLSKRLRRLLKTQDLLWTHNTGKGN